MEKTEQEIQEADRQEAQIEVDKNLAHQRAYEEFHAATKEAFEKYTSIWHPAKAEWEAFSKPFFKTLQAKLVTAWKAEELALREVRSNWGKCPQCGTPFNRYQTFCSNDTGPNRCGINLIIGGTGRFIDGK